MQKLVFKIILLLSFSFLTLHAQEPKKLNSVEIYNQIQKLNFLGEAIHAVVSALGWCDRVFITQVKGTFFGMSESEEASKRR
jgi:hypothetical protein